MSNLKILILLFYYNRPKMVRNALESILLANDHYTNWVLGFNDDGSDQPGRPVVEEVLKDHLNKVEFFRTDYTWRDKVKAGGSLVGAGMNELIKRVSDANIGIMLCDDDALYPDYLVNLNKYFNENPKVMSCYSNLVTYNPLIQSFKEAIGQKIDFKYLLNHNKTPINGHCKIDASQGAWRIKCNKINGVWFKSPCGRDHDKFFYNDLYKKCGPMHYTGFVGQIKGIHNLQLGNLKFREALKNNIDITNPS